MCICITDSLCCTLETTPILYINYTPIKVFKNTSFDVQLSVSKNFCNCALISNQQNSSRWLERQQPHNNTHALLLICWLVLGWSSNWACNHFPSCLGLALVVLTPRPARRVCACVYSTLWQNFSFFRLSWWPSPTVVFSSRLPASQGPTLDWETALWRLHSQPPQWHEPIPCNTYT